MIIPQKKLTLNSPYHQINEALWQNKTSNTHFEKENLRLKTQMHKLARKQKQQTKDPYQQKMEEKCQKLSVKYKEQATWIKNITQLIEERHFEALTQSVKKIENKLKSVTHKCLSLQDRLKKSYLKQQEQENQRVMTASAEPENSLEILQKDKKRLENFLQAKLKEAEYLEFTNKELNKQLIKLLAVKNALKEQTKKKISKMELSRTGFIKTAATKEEQ